MAIGTVTWGTVATGSTGTTASVAYPATPAAGDGLFLFCYCFANAASAFSQPAGWQTAVAATATASGSYAVFYKSAAGTESGSLTVTIASTTDTYLCRMCKIPGADTSASAANLDGGPTKETETGTSPGVVYSNAGVTTASPGSLVVLFTGSKDCITNSETDSFASWAGNSLTWAGVSNGTTSGSDASMGVGTAVKPAAGATGALTVSLQDSQTTYAGISCSFAILAKTMPVSKTATVGALVGATIYQRTSPPTSLSVDASVTSGSSFNVAVTAPGTSTLTVVDALIQAAGAGTVYEKSATVSALTGGEVAKTATASAAIAVATSKTATTDAVIGTAVAKTAALDALITGVNAKTATVDGLIAGTPGPVATVGAAIGAAAAKTATVDTQIVTRPEKSATVTALIQGAIAKTSTIDAYISAPGVTTQEKSSTVSAAIAAATPHGTTLDAAIATGIAKTITIGALVGTTVYQRTSPPTGLSVPASVVTGASFNVAATAPGVSSLTVVDALIGAAGATVTKTATAGTLVAAAGSGQTITVTAAIGSGVGKTATVDAVIFGGTWGAATVGTVIAAGASLAATVDTYIIAPSTLVRYYVDGVLFATVPASGNNASGTLSLPWGTHSIYATVQVPGEGESLPSAAQTITIVLDEEEGGDFVPVHAANRFTVSLNTSSAVRVDPNPPDAKRYKVTLINPSATDRIWYAYTQAACQVGQTHCIEPDFGERDIFMDSAMQLWVVRGGSTTITLIGEEGITA